MIRIVNPLVIFGAGGHASAVIAAAHASEIVPSLVADDDPRQETYFGIPLIPSSATQALGAFRFVIAIGDCKIRRAKFDWLLSLGGEPETIVHPRAFISEFTEIGAGTVIFSMAHIDPSVSIGDNCIVNAGAIVAHDCLIESHVHIAPNVGLCSGIHVREGAWVGVGSSAIQGVEIGAWSYIGAGSVVVRDVPARHKAYGNPAHRNCEPISHGSQASSASSKSLTI